MTNAANAAAIAEPDASVAVGDWQGARGVLETTSFAPPTSSATITKVEVISRLRVHRRARRRPSQRRHQLVRGSRADSVSTATLNAIGTTFGTVAVDVTAAKAWTWADLADPATFVHLETVKVAGPDTPTIEIDAVGLRVTTTSTIPTGGVFDEISTLNVVPLADTFDPARLEFVSASVPPTTINHTTGTISWADVGPINAGVAKVVTVTFRVREPLNNATQIDVNNTATVADPTFANGLPANDDSAAAVITVNPRGLDHRNRVVRGLGGSNGWVGTTGYQSSIDHFVPDVTVQLLACQVGGTNLYPAGNTGRACTHANNSNGVWTLVQTATTGSNGGYAFTGLASGYYYVNVVTSSLPGTVAATADPDVVPGLCAASCTNTWKAPTANLGLVLIISTANDLVNGNFGYTVAPSIYGNLWNDVDGDGTQEIGEGALSGWTAQLYNGASLVATTTTNTFGDYRFANLAAATTYTVKYVSPSGQTWIETFESDSTIDNSISATTIAGVSSGSLDFGLRQSGTASVGDTVYFDIDHDAVRDATEEGVPGVPVTLYRDSDGDGVLNLAVDAVAAMTTTAADGTYLFGSLPPATYVVGVDHGSALLLSTIPTADPNESGVCVTCDARSGAITLAAGAANLVQDFGFDPLGTGSIGDLIWFDRDGDGSRDSNESGIGSVTVTLLADLNGDGTFTPFQTTTTNALGAYVFDGLPDGSFRVTVDTADTDLPTDGFGITAAATTATTHDVSIVDGSMTTAADFGFANLGAIGNTVFADANSNGTQDWNESGVANVAVQLWEDLDADGTYALLDTTLTDIDGAYSFSALQPGSYRIVIVESSLPWATVTRTADPDRDGVACDDGSYPVLAACDGMQSAIAVAHGTTFMGADFGYQPPGALGDFVWRDGDGDGVQDAGRARHRRRHGAALRRQRRQRYR